MSARILWTVQVLPGAALTLEVWGEWIGVLWSHLPGSYTEDHEEPDGYRYPVERETTWIHPLHHGMMGGRFLGESLPPCTCGR